MDLKQILNMEQIPGQKFTVKHNGPLLEYLYEIFPEQSKKGVKAYLSNGQVVLNGRKVTAFDQPLWKGDTLVILAKKYSIYTEVKHAARVDLKDSGVEILYEDDSIIVVNKRSGLPVVGTGKSAGKAVDLDKKGGKASLMTQHRENTVYSILCDYTRTRVHAERMSSTERMPWKPAHVFIVHRLDRDTSGVLVFAKTAKIQRLLQDGWNSIVKERGYTGIVEGTPSPLSGTVESWLKDNPKSKKVMSTGDEALVEKENARVRPGNHAELWHHAVTHYETVKKDITYKRPDVDPCMKYSAVEFHLDTGRKNQIRVHASAELGCPVAGDKKYGAVSSPAGRLALHAGTLAFVHPVTGKLMTFTSALPKEFGL